MPLPTNRAVFFSPPIAERKWCISVAPVFPSRLGTMERNCRFAAHLHSPTPRCAPSAHVRDVSLSSSCLLPLQPPPPTQRAEVKHFGGRQRPTRASDTRRHCRRVKLLLVKLTPGAGTSWHQHQQRNHVNRKLPAQLTLSVEALMPFGHCETKRRRREEIRLRLAVPLPICVT